MKNFIKVFVLPFMLLNQAAGQDLVELKKENANTLVLKYMFNAGSMMDPAGKEGLTQLTASLMIGGGTETYSISEINNLLYPMAGQYAQSVDKEVTVFSFVVHADFTHEFYDIIRGMIFQPAFDEKDFKRIRSNQLNYVEQIIKASSDEDYSKMALEDLLYRGTRYQHMVAGTLSGIQNITIEDIREHYRTFFTRDNLLLGVAGKFGVDFKTRVVNEAGQLPALSVSLPEPPEVDMPDGFQVEIIRKDNTLGSALFTGFPIGVTRADDEFAALMIANSWLGEHRKSYGQLYEKIRDIRSMNYGNYSYIEWYQNGGSNQLPPPHVPRQSNYFSIWIRPVQIAEQLKMQYPELEDIRVGHAHFALRMAVRELDMLIRHGITEEEFKLTRQFLRSYIKLYIQTPSRELGFLMDSRFYGRNDYISELDQLLADLTAEDVNAAVRKYLQVENMFVSIITDNSEAQALAEHLKSNTPSPMSYSNLIMEGLPEEVIQEDKTVANYPLNIKSVKIIESGETF
ncbi:MAG: insulinase family protein [Cyclobacteriaceae bacterium]|nr:insulinase family protein [Cyclobacteriaceae bacterium]